MTLRRGLALALLGAALFACAPAAQPSAPPTAAPAKPATAPTAAAVAPTGTPAAQAARQAPPPPQAVRVGVVGTTGDAPYYLAEQRGYFREAGVEPQLQVFQSGALMIAPLGADQLDVAGGSALSAGLYNAVARGIDLRIVAGRYGEDGSVAMVVRKELLDGGRVRSAADLRGLRVQWAAECISPEVTLSQYLATGGLTIQDVESVYMAFPDTPAAIANGSIDVANTIEPFATIINRAGTGAIFHRYEVPRQVAVMLYSPTFAANRELATAFMEATLRGTRDYYNALFGDRREREEVIQVLIEKTNLKNRELYDQIVLARLDPNGELNRQSLSDDQEYYVAKGCQPQRIDLARAVDTSFVEAAVARLGRYPTSDGR